MLKLTDEAVSRLIRHVVARMQGGRVDLLGADESILASFPFPPKERVRLQGRTASTMDKMETDAVGSGEVVTVLLTGPDGGEMMRGDAGDLASSAFLRIDNVNVFKGGLVEIVSATVEVV